MNDSGNLLRKPSRSSVKSENQPTPFLMDLASSSGDLRVAERKLWRVSLDSHVGSGGFALLMILLRILRILGRSLHWRKRRLAYCR